MKINVDLNAQSIQNAINALKTAERQLNEQMFNDLLIAACEWIKAQANSYLALSTIGSSVRTSIENGWVIGTPTNGTITMTNTADKAVYVEFGVGAVGAQDKHKNADETGYEYNKPSPYKRAGRYHDKDTWRFVTHYEEAIDLPEGSYEEWQRKDGSLKIITRGAKGTMYAYNAIMDFRGAKIAQTIWQNIKVKYWG